MGDRQYPDRRTALDVGQVVRERPQINAPVSAGPEPGCVVMTVDPADTAIHFIPETMSQTLLFSLVSKCGLQ